VGRVRSNDNPFDASCSGKRLVQLTAARSSSMRRSPAPEAKNYKMKLKPAGQNAKKLGILSGLESLCIRSTRSPLHMI